MHIYACHLLYCYGRSYFASFTVHKALTISRERDMLYKKTGTLCRQKLQRADQNTHYSITVVYTYTYIYTQPARKSKPEDAVIRGLSIDGVVTVIYLKPRQVYRFIARAGQQRPGDDMAILYGAHLGDKLRGKAPMGGACTTSTALLLYSRTGSLSGLSSPSWFALQSCDARYGNGGTTCLDQF